MTTAVSPAAILSYRMNPVAQLYFEKVRDEAASLRRFLDKLQKGLDDPSVNARMFDVEAAANRLSRAIVAFDAAKAADEIMANP